MFCYYHLIKEKNSLSLHYNVNNSFLYAKGVKIFQFKVKDFEIKPYLLYMGNISK